MVAFGECGFAAEIPAFAGMEGCVELAAAFSFISPTPIPAKAGISLPSNCKKTMRCERCSPQQTGRFPPSREWKGGGAKAGISFSQQREFSAKRNIAMFAFGECGFAAEIPAFAGMEGCVELAAAFSFISPTPIPAKAGISLPSNCKKTMRCERCSPQQTGRFPPSREWKGGGAKAGILFSRQREFSAKRNIAMFAFGECGFAAEIPAFAGMEVGEALLFFGAFPCKRK